jgi:hypothetical protein
MADCAGLKKRLGSEDFIALWEEGLHPKDRVSGWVWEITPEWGTAKNGRTLSSGGEGREELGRSFPNAKPLCIMGSWGVEVFSPQACPLGSDVAQPSGWYLWLRVCPKRCISMNTLITKGLMSPELGSKECPRYHSWFFHRPDFV